jgi:hypothetical protein
VASTTTIEDSVPEQLINDVASALATHRASDRETDSVPARSGCGRNDVGNWSSKLAEMLRGFGCLPLTSACRTTKAHTPETTIAYDPEVE